MVKIEKLPDENVAYHCVYEIKTIIIIIVLLKFHSLFQEWSCLKVYGVPAIRGRVSLGSQFWISLFLNTLAFHQEKAAGRNSAIEETKAMMAKMRSDERERLAKYRNDSGLLELKPKVNETVQIVVPNVLWYIEAPTSDCFKQQM